MTRPTIADLQAVLRAEADDVPEADDILTRAGTRRATWPQRRWLVVTATAVITLLVVGIIAILRADSTGQKQTSSSPHFVWRTFSAPSWRFTVDYPSTWHMARFDEDSSFSAAIVFFSNQTMTPPCATSFSGHMTTVSCRGQALTHLDAGSFSIEWMDQSGPNFSGESQLHRATGRHTTIGGQPAKIYIGPTKDCAALDARTSVIATIRRAGVQDDVFEMRACVNAARNSAQVDLILRSLHTMRQH